MASLTVSFISNQVCSHTSLLSNQYTPLSLTCQNYHSSWHCVLCQFVCWWICLSNKHHRNIPLSCE